MSSDPIAVTPDERPKALDFGGEDITVLASGAQTDSYEIFLQVGREAAVRLLITTRGTRLSSYSVAR